MDEAEQYFSSDEERKAEYVRPNMHPSSKALWWLRSPGYSNKDAAFVYETGMIEYSGIVVNEEDNIGVRPVIRMAKDAGTVTPDNTEPTTQPTEPSTTDASPSDPDLIGTWYYENGGETLYMTFQEDGTVYQKREKNGVVKQSETATYVIIEKGVIAFIQNGNEMERDDYKIEGDKLTMQEQNRNDRITLARVR